MNQQLKTYEWMNIKESLIFIASGKLNPDSFEETIKTTLDIEFDSTILLMLVVDDITYKLNGYECKLLWMSGIIDLPDYIDVSSYKVLKPDYDSLHKILRRLLIPFLEEKEYVSYILNDLGKCYKSQWIYSSTLLDVLNIVLRGSIRKNQNKIRYREEIDLFDCLIAFDHELSLLDSLSKDIPLFSTGVLAGCLIMLGIGYDVGKFIVTLIKKASALSEMGQIYDPFDSLLANIFNSSGLINNKNMEIKLCQITIHAIKQWSLGKKGKGYYRQKKLAGTNHLPYVIKLRNKVRIDLG